MSTEKKAALTTTQKGLSKVDVALLGIMEELRTREARLEMLLPKGMDPQRFTESARLALAAEPKLLKCTPASLVLAVLRGALTGLPVHGGGGLAYIVPYGEEATYVPGYKGLISLGKATGIVRDMQPVLVHDKDVFEIEEGDSPRLTHRPYIPRKADDFAGAVIAAYTRVLLPDGERVIKGLLYAPDLARIEASSRAKNGPRNGPHREEMQKKDTLKNAYKTLGVPPGDVFKALRIALAADEAAESGVVDAELAAVESFAKPTGTERMRAVVGLPSGPVSEVLEDHEEPLPMSHPGAEPPQDVVLPGQEGA